MLHHYFDEKGQEQFNGIIVLSQSESQIDEDDEEWNGFVDSIRKIFSIYFQSMQERITTQSKESQV
jgi:hypothetical protein